ncbi:MAG: M20/M25/M40 family metallo-hydrolase [Myxococcota bacterium]
MLFLTLTLAAAAVDPSILAQAQKLRDLALEDRTAYTMLESLTTEIGPRLAGTEAERRARGWSEKYLRRLGFKRVSVEPFDLETWVRGEETAEILAPYPQPLVVTALGRSGSARNLSGEVVYFSSFQALEEAESLQGKIAFIDHGMGKTQDGSSYSYFGKARFNGPSVAAAKGAKAVMIRSVGTHSHRIPHTGATSWKEGQSRVPAVAVSPPDADQIKRIVDSGKPLRVRMTVTPRVLGIQKSGNVVAELRGNRRPGEIIIAGGHLDSWDLGTGAVDDGAGVVITTAALHLIRKSGLKPARTIRVVHWGAEEVGLVGAKAYAKAHVGENFILGSESDFGAERIFRIDSNVSSEGQAVVDEMVRLLAPLGVAQGRKGSDYGGSSGPDLSPLNATGLPRFRLAQDGTDYFDLHHTPDDTFDKVKPDALAQNVAAYAVFLWIAANVDTDFRKPAVANSGE